MKIKVIRQQVLDFYNNNEYTYEEVGKKFGISKQRVHQIIRNYNTGASRLSPSWHPVMRIKTCQMCGEPSQVIHHINGNSHHNYDKNLLPLCYDCHINIHLKRPKNYKPLTFVGNYDTLKLQNIMKPNRLPRLTPTQRIKVVTDYLSGFPIKDIMAKYNISKATLYRIIKMTTDEVEAQINI